MKKLSVMITLSLFLLVSRASAANEHTIVPASVSSEFSQEFTHVKNVAWAQTGNFYKATFRFKGRVCFAYYTANSEFIGIASNLLSDRLPQSLKAELKKKFSGYWITDLFRFSNNDESGFVITLENPDRVIILKSTDGQSWGYFQGSAKS